MAPALRGAGKRNEGWKVLGAKRISRQALGGNQASLSCGWGSRSLAERLA